MSDYTTQSGRKLYFFNELDSLAQRRAAYDAADNAWTDDWRNAVNDELYYSGVTDNFNIDCDFFDLSDWLTISGRFDIDELAYAAQYDYTRPVALPYDLQIDIACTVCGNRLVQRFDDDRYDELCNLLSIAGLDRYDANVCIRYIESIVSDFAFRLFDCGEELMQSYSDADNVAHEDQLYYSDGSWWGACGYGAIDDGPIYDNLAAII